MVRTCRTWFFCRWATKVKRRADLINGAPGAIRTPDLVLRRHTLYPAELRARRAVPLILKHFSIPQQSVSSSIGQSLEWTPKLRQVLYLPHDYFRRFDQDLIVVARQRRFWTVWRDQRSRSNCMADR